MNHMTISEAVAFMRGQNRRHRQSWEQTRMLAAPVYAMVGKPLELEFPWDDEQEQYRKETTDEELAALRALARQEEARLNGRNPGNL